MCFLKERKKHVITASSEAQDPTATIPAFFAMMGLNVASGMLKTAASNVEQEVKLAKSVLEPKSEAKGYTFR